MRKIVNFAVTYPVTITMVIFAILLLGKISYDRLGVDLLPSLNSSKLYIELTTVDMPPVEVEKQIVEDIEAAAIRTENARDVYSVIRESGALITVEYQWGKDVDDAYLDLQKAVALFEQNKDIEEIYVSQTDPSSKPVVLVSLTHDQMSPVDLTAIAENYIRPQLLSVAGVADVQFSGTLEREIVVSTDPYRLEAFGVTVDEIAAKIGENNYTIAGGRIEDLGLHYIVSGSNVIETIDEFSSIIVGYRERDKFGVSSDEQSSGEGSGVSAAIYLGDVATISLDKKERESIVRYNGKEGLGVEIYKERDFNTLKATTEIKSKLEAIERAMPQYKLEIVSDQGAFIESSIGQVKDSALLGMLLAVVVLFLFLRRIGTTLVIALAIPLSIITTFTMFYFGGLTLNVMTLGGLALGAGMLVDNAIVVIESIFRKQEGGVTIKDAVIEGTSEVGGAIIASTLTTIVVFLPIVYLQGESGELFKEQAWSVTFALLSSLFVAILIIPVMYSKFLSRRKVSKQNETIKSIKITGYAKLLTNVLNHRYKVVLVALLFVVGVFMLAQNIGSEFMPRSSSKSVDVNIEFAQGSTIDYSNAAIVSLESVIRQIVGEDSVSIYSHVGVAGSDGGTTAQSNQAMIKINLADSSLYDIDYVVDNLSAHLSSIDGVKATFIDSQGSISSLVSEEEGDIVVEVRGDKLDELMAINQVVAEQLSLVDGIKSLSYQMESSEKEIVVTVDRVAASVYGLTMQNVISGISSHLSGSDAGEMDVNGRVSNIVVRLPKISTSDLATLQIMTSDKKIAISEVATINYVDAPSQILRNGQSRVMNIAIDCDDKIALSSVADNVRSLISDLDVPSGYSVSIEGSEQRRVESMESLLFALTLSIILVYMVMASQFESLLHPFTILLTIPLAVAGALLMFVITGKSLNIMAAIGIIMLVGIAVNSSILLVDRIGQLIAASYPLKDAIVAAASQRVRPILMTTLTTVLALIPMALSIGEGAEFQSSMAIAVVGGLMMSTILSLVVIPAVYYIFESAKRRLFRVEQ